MPGSPERPVRWWPLAIILLLAIAAIVFWWLQPDAIRQMRVLRTMLTAAAALLLLILWLMLLSRLPWRTRLTWLVVLLGLGFALRASVRIEGVSGDLVPVLGWRWGNATERGGPAVTDRRPQTTAHAAWPQFLGPNRDGHVTAVELVRDWQSRPPSEIWRRPVGSAWSSFAVVDGIAVTQEQDADDETVVARSLATGEVLWRHADPARYETTLGGIGPRGTPTIHAGSVYTLGATGILNALDLATGERRWTRDIAADNDASMPPWGYSASPLVHAGLIIINAGGPDGRSLVAHDAATGDVVWSGGDDAAGYASPFVTRLAGAAQILTFNVASVAAHDPRTGAQLWSFPWSGDQPNVTQPVPLTSDRVLVTSGYGVGVKLLQVTAGAAAFDVELLWETRRLKSKFANVLVDGEAVFGLDDGILVSLDPATGERRWKSGRYGHGQLLLVGATILVQAESGELVLVDADPDQFVELARIDALPSRTWNHPAFAVPYLLVRNDREAICYELPIASPVD